MSLDFTDATGGGSYISYSTTRPRPLPRPPGAVGGVCSAPVSQPPDDLMKAPGGDFRERV